MDKEEKLACTIAWVWAWERPTETMHHMCFPCAYSCLCFQNLHLFWKTKSWPLCIASVKHSWLNAGAVRVAQSPSCLIRFPLSSSLIAPFSVTTEVAFLQELYSMWQPSNGCQCEQKLTYLSGHLKREVIGLESSVSSGKCILEGVEACSDDWHFPLSLHLSVVYWRRSSRRVRKTRWLPKIHFIRRKASEWFSERW